VDEYVRLLAAEAPIVTCTSGLTWSFASAPSFASGSAFLGGPSLALEPRGGGQPYPLVPQIASGTVQGDHLLARLAREAMPTALRTLGFTSESDFWPPWCVALQDGEIASIAFASRLQHVPHKSELPARRRTPRPALPRRQPLHHLTAIFAHTTWDPSGETPVTQMPKSGTPPGGNAADTGRQSPRHAARSSAEKWYATTLQRPNSV
jgi:hypothetical protein